MHDDASRPPLQAVQHVRMSECFVDLYPVDVSREVDRRDGVDAESGRYRRVFQRMAVKGLPRRVPVGDVLVWFVEGPIQTQRTELRQRPGLPFAFDKHTKRAASVGEGGLLTVIELPVSLDDGMAIDAWRARTDAALGLLMNCLDERVAGKQLAEDVILMREGRPVAAADRVALVRSAMPFEVTA